MKAPDVTVENDPGAANVACDQWHHTPECWAAVEVVLRLYNAVTEVGWSRDHPSVAAARQFLREHARQEVWA